MNYKTLADLSYDIKANLHKIPNDVSLVVGIPRSGLLAANLLSIYLNVPLTDIDSFIDGGVITNGLCGQPIADAAFKGHILIVDDSIHSGRAIVDARQKLSDIPDANKYIISFCCVYVHPCKINMVDISLVSLDMPRIFEWNLFHHTYLTKACVSFDGILCVAPDGSEANAKVDYAEFLKSARPKFLPKVVVKTIVASGTKEHRRDIEDWLTKHGIQYEELVMLDLPTSNPSLIPIELGKFKAIQYRKRKNSFLYIENNRNQAQKIFEATGKNVYCMDTNEMFWKEASYADLTIEKTDNFLRSLKKFAKRIMMNLNLKPIPKKTELV